jgi:hypothetical protein
MLRLVMLLAVLLYALRQGGTLTNFARLRVRRVPLIVGGFAIRLLVDTPFLPEPLVPFWTAPLFLLSFGLLIWWVWENRHLAGGGLIGAGVIMNLAVITANGGAMPVDPVAALYAGKSTDIADAALPNVHRAFGDQVQLWMLADIFPVPAGIPFAAVYSVGDLILTIGVAILCYHTMLTPTTPALDAARAAPVAPAPIEP